MTSLFLAQNVQNNKQMDSIPPPPPTPTVLPARFELSADMKLKIWNKCLRQIRWSKPKRMVFLETTHTQFRITEQLKMNKNTVFTVLSELLQHAIYIFIQSFCLAKKLHIENLLEDQIMFD